MTECAPRLYLQDKVRVFHGDSREVLRTLGANSIDSVVCDPPYALVSIVKRFGKDGSAACKVPENGTGAYARASAGFMGKKWDTGETAFSADFWAEVLRVLKPGGHVIAASGTRTYHRLAVAIEDAGFEIRDMVSWLYGAGFPKSHDVSKGMDKSRNDKPDVLAVTTAMADAAEIAGISRSMVDSHMGTSDMGGWWLSRLLHRCACPTWDQWLRLKAFLSMGDAMDVEVWRLNGRKGTPGEAWAEREIIGLATDGSGNGSVVGLGSGGNLQKEYNLTAPATPAAAQWQGWGTALKPACEPWVLARKPLIGTVAANVLEYGTGAINVDGCRVGTGEDRAAGGKSGSSAIWNVESDSSRLERPDGGRWPANVIHDGSEEVLAGFPEGRSAGDYPSESIGTGNGTTYLPTKPQGALYADAGSAARFFYTAKADGLDRIGSRHPTVKPVDLMRYLCRLITPPGGMVLDPFAGTGTTGEAAWLEGFSATLIEREAEYIADIERRMKLCLAGPEEKARAIIKAKGKTEAPGPLFAESAA